MQDGAEPDKLQVSEKSQKSRAILGRSGANGIVSDQVQVGFCIGDYLFMRVATTLFLNASI